MAWFIFSVEIDKKNHVKTIQIFQIELYSIVKESRTCFQEWQTHSTV